MRILFAGCNWHGSNARSCAESLRRLGYNVLDIDEQTFFPECTRFTSRIVRRLFWFRMVDEFNRNILAEAKRFRPDIFIAFKGNYIEPETLQHLRKAGITLYNYYPDTSAFSHGKWLARSLPEYDCIFYTKPFWYGDVIKRIPLKSGVFLPHGYSPELHRPVVLDAVDRSDCGCDVSFIAAHMPHKEQILSGLISLRPDLDLRIWGWRWAERCQTAALRRCIMGYPILGEACVRAIIASRINLAIMSGRVAGASSGDLTTSRTYTIPASGGFMLHERNPEVLELYREGQEIECFDTVEELAEKIDYYLAHPEERERIAKAGHARCVPAYSYDNRMAELMRCHFERRSNMLPNP